MTRNAWPESLLRLGTCSWTAKGWAGAFYPPGTPPREYIRVYAQHYPTVEIDATFYGVPKRNTVEAWRDLTPPGFRFAAKAPKAITHEEFLQDAGGDLRVFLGTMSLLEERLGPILFQFPYFAERRGVTLQDFLERLAPFLRELPKGFSYAVEVRNRTWLSAPLTETLAENGIALAPIDHPWMAPPIKAILDRQIPVYAYVNSHYSGYAPADVDALMALHAPPPPATADPPSR